VLLALALHAQNASVAVSVVDSFNNSPVPNVELRLAAGNRPLDVSVLRTDASGKASFENLRPGTYSLQYLRDGYLDSKVIGSARSVQIKEGTTVTEVKIQLAQSAKIEGRVLDEDGRPLSGVTAHSFVAQAVTDAEGRFRLEGMGLGPSRLYFEIPLDIRNRTLERNTKTGLTLGYPAVEYYPGVANPAESTMISMAGGVDLHGYDVRLRRVRLADFTGRTMARAGGPLTSAHVELQTPASGNPMLDASFSPHPVDEDGSFRFDLIPPGAYTLLIYRGENGRGLPYIIPIEIGKEGLRDKEIIVPPFQTIRGMLRVRDEAEWSGEVNVAVTTQQKGVTTRDLKVTRSGEFSIQDVPPGEWQFEIADRGPVRLSDKRKLAVTSTRFGASNPMAGPISIAESGNPVLEIELSTDTGRIAGEVAGGAKMVFITRAGTMRLAMGRPILVSPDGSFVTEELAAGFYELRAGAAKVVKVEVKAGETANVEIR
jgi:hypothetical protein